MSNNLKTSLENIEELLTEAIADILDTAAVNYQQILAGIDKKAKADEELHLKVAKAAMQEYKKVLLTD